MGSDAVAGNIPDLALRGAESFGDRPAVVDGDVVLSFTALRDEMLAVGAALVASGVTPGDRVALWSPNSAAWISAALGTLVSGAVLVPLNTRFTAHEAAYVLNTVDAKVLLAPESFLGRDHVGELRVEAPGLRALADTVALPAPGEMTTASWVAFLGRAAPDGADAVLARIAAIGADDVSDIIFTSGTTGNPKGVMLRHGASLRGFGAFNDSWRVTEGDRVLIGLPFFHCFGYKAGWMVDLLAGATTYPLAVFDGLAVMQMIERHAITHLPGSPTMFWPLLDDPRAAEYDLTSLRAVIIGGASIPVELVRRLKNELGLAQVQAGYGLTENHAIISFSQPDDSPEVVATTVGKVLDGLEVVTADDDGRPLPPGSEGELLARGDMHMTGYYGDPEATAAAYTSDGWLRTGDVGTVDEHGYVRITDRKKDIYITGGFNVAPAEVENVLLAFADGVGQVAVVGVPDARLGEVGAAFVVPAPGCTVREADVLAYAKEHLANYKVPRRVEIVDALPTNATGKVLKNELRARLAAVAT